MFCGTKSLANINIIIINLNIKSGGSIIKQVYNVAELIMYYAPKGHAHKHSCVKLSVTVFLFSILCCKCVLLKCLSVSVYVSLSKWELPCLQ